MTAVEIVRPARRIGLDRSRYSGAASVVVGVVALFLFGLGSRTNGGVKARFQFNLVDGGGTHVPDLVIPAGAAAIGLSALCAAIGVVRLLIPLSKNWRITATTVFLAGFVIAFLCWATAGRSLNIASVLYSTVAAAVPLTLGAFAGVMGERSGVINVGIEGQLLLGAFAAVYAASATGSLWAGLVAGCLSGALLGALLGLFANRYRVEQVVLGVVLTLLATGVTGFLYDRLMQTNADKYNKALNFSSIRIPGLAAIPVIGPVLFNENIIVYITMVLLVLLHVALFHSRWGLRTRAVGEHPTAADTVGIKVLRTRYVNLTVGGLFAGLGGVWLTIGQGLSFTKDMSQGKGFIALAALIFGRWSPIGSMAAAVLFGFAGGLSIALQPLGTPVPTQFLAMAPYLATIFAVAGLVGAVRAPAADGQPYTR